MRAVGLVKWFDNNKGFGLIGTPEGVDFFAHINNFQSPPKKIEEGDALSFKKKANSGSGRNSALECRPVSSWEDWVLIMSYLGMPDDISTETGNQYSSISLKERAFIHFYANVGKATFIKTIKDYFEKELKRDLFIEYCQLIEKIFNYSISLKQNDELLNLFAYFGEKMDDTIRFLVWSTKKYKYISNILSDENEIPEGLLRKFKEVIGIEELSRVSKFSYGQSFSHEISYDKIQNISNSTLVETKYAYNYLQFINEEKRRECKLLLDKFLFLKAEEEIFNQSALLGDINSEIDLEKYKKLYDILDFNTEDIDYSQIKHQVDDLISSRSSAKFKIKLWLDNKSSFLPFDALQHYFCNDEFNDLIRIKILSKLELEQQFILLCVFTQIKGWKLAFDLLELCISRECNIYNFKLSEEIYNSDFLLKNRFGALIIRFLEYEEITASETEKFDLFFQGYYRNFPKSKFLENLNILDENKCKVIFKLFAEDKEYLYSIVLGKLDLFSEENLDWICDLTNTYLISDQVTQISKKIFSAVKSETYMHLWEKKRVSIFPLEYLKDFLYSDPKPYSKLQLYISSSIVTKAQIIELIISYLKQNEIVSDRIIFYRQFNHIKFILEQDKDRLNEILNLGNDLYDLILWRQGLIEHFNFNLLKQKFIYFHPLDQVFIIKKLFSLIEKGEMSITVEGLDELLRFDLDLYKINQEFNPDISVDLSTEVVINALKSFDKNHKFLVESELISVVLNNLKSDKTQKFKLDHYFEKCQGRQIVKYLASFGTVKKISTNQNDYFFAIEFEYDAEIVDLVKKIPGRRWNGEDRRWEVPSIYENAVLQFATNNRFYLDFTSVNSSGNVHLASFIRSSVPAGVAYCEGRIANKPHDKYKKTFWWCNGQSCFQKCETIHNSDNWPSYSLLDFCRILGFNTDETNKMGDNISKGLYYQFIGTINRFNRLLEKMYCRECNHILFPSDFGTSHFAAYNVIRFSCQNNECSQHNQEIYLNHCLNGQCNTIIDSRDSKKCPNGLFICASCGSCCSHDMLSRRLLNLSSVGGYIHPNLKRSVDEKKGHLERAKYYCHKCSQEMKETYEEIFHCSACNVTYNTQSFNFKRIHRNLNIEDKKDSNKSDNQSFIF